MLSIVEKLFVDWLVPDDKRDDDTFLLKLCVSALETEEIEIPSKYKVTFNPDNPYLGNYVCLDGDILFPYATSIFLNKEKAYSAIKKIGTSTIVICLNLLMILEALKEDSFKTSYEIYKDIVYSQNLSDIIFEKETFEELVDAILFFPIDESKRIVHMKDGTNESGNAIEAAKLMKDALKLSHDDQIAFLFFEREVVRLIKKKQNRRSYTKDQCREIVMHILSQVKTWDTFKRSPNYVSKAMNCVIAIENCVDPLPVLKAIEVYKKTKNYSIKKGNETKYSPGSTYNMKTTALVEANVIKEEIRSLCLCIKDERHRIVIINPSISLIESLVVDKNIDKSNLTFVIENEQIVSLLSDRNTEQISFLSLSSYIVSPVPEYREILICINPQGLLPAQIKRISDRKRINSLSLLFALDNDSSFSSDNSLAGLEKDYIVSVMFLPLGLEGGAKGKYCLWFSARELTDDVTVESTCRKNIKEKSVMKVDIRGTFKKDELFVKGSSTHLRTRRRELRPKENSYLSNLPYFFSDNIKIFTAGLSFAYLFLNDVLKVTFSIQFRDGDCFRPVEKAKFSKTFHALDDAREFLHKYYPFYLKSIGRKGSADKCYIGELVRTEMSRVRVKYPDSLKEFVFLFYKELRASMDDYGIKTLIDIAFNSKLSDESISVITPEDVRSVLEEREVSNIVFSQSFNAFTLAFDVARDKHLIYKNDFREIENDRLRWSRLFGNVRGLVKKNFTRDEFRVVYSYLSAALERENQVNDEKQKAKYLCILISLLSGIEANVVCALKWKDLQRTQFGFYKVRIVRQLTNDSREERGIVDIHDYRTVPLGRILSKLLDKVYVDVEQRVFAEGKNRKCIGGLYVLGSYCSTISKMTERIAPQDVSKEINRIIEKVLCIREQLVYVPDYNGGTKEVNLSRYHGDFLRENFKYHASDLAGFTEDEIAFFVGNACLTTMGCHYIDYDSEVMILSLNTKLDRISSFLEQDRKKISDKSGAFFRESSPTTLDVAFTTEANCNVIISASHGAFISVEEDDGVHPRQYLQEL